MSMIRLLYLVVFCMQITAGASIRNTYGIKIETVEVCPDNDKIPSHIRNFKFGPYNSTHKALSYDFTYVRPIDEKIGIGIAGARWVNNEWVATSAIKSQSNICRYILRFFKTQWVDFHRNVGVTHPDRCPIPAGNYSVHNYIVDTAELRIPFITGRFRFTITYDDVENKEILLCLMFIINTDEEM